MARQALQWQGCSGEGCGPQEGFVAMDTALMVTDEARKELSSLIERDDKKRTHIRIFIQGWG